MTDWLGRGARIDPVRARRRAKEAQRRLKALGANAPALPPDALQAFVRERAQRALRRAIARIAVVLVVILAAAQWFRPIPAPALRSALPEALRLPGRSPQLPTPNIGAIALSVPGVRTVGSRGSATPMLMGGLAEVMTAYVVLQDHPLDVGASGPPVPVTAGAIDASQLEAADGQPVVAVEAGETLTELQSLQALLLASAADIADLLATWDGGDVSAFVAKMNQAASRLGMHATTFGGPSGFDASSMSTAKDMVVLGRAAMAIPAFGAIVAAPQVTLPVAGTVYNLNFEVGRSGFIGIKTGSDNAAGGCFLFAADVTVAGATVTLVGALLGIRSSSPTAGAVFGAVLEVEEASAALQRATVLTPGRQVATVIAPWGASVPVVTAGPAIIVGWPGSKVPIRITSDHLPTTFDPGVRVGVVRGLLATQGFHVELRAGRALAGPSAIWRLTRL